QHHSPAQRHHRNLKLQLTTAPRRHHTRHPFLHRPASLPQRTAIAIRRTRLAHQCPQLHQRLVELPSPTSRHQLLRQRPQLRLSPSPFPPFSTAFATPPPKKPPQHPPAIRLDDRHRPVICLRQHCTHRVTTKAW